MWNFFFFLILLSAHFSLASTLIPPGYTNNVANEREQVFYEISFEVPRLNSELELRELIFNPLEKEFKDKYRENFGENDTRSIVYRSQAIGGVQQQPIAIEEETQKRKLFAEYMVKRLADYHVDNYMKTKPEMRPIMEVKEQIQNVKVEVNKDVRLNIQYNVVVNFADIVVDNPYVESKLSLEMDPRSFGPSEIIESRIWVNKSINTYWRINTNVATVDGISYGDVTRYFPKKNASVILSASSYFRESGKSLRQSQYLISASKTF